jgi:hypothetical protein
VEPGVENLPGEQAVHVADSADLLNLPAGQLRHADASALPGLGAYVPGAQPTQAISKPLLYVPAGH